jgi:hypothetical protein
MKYTTWRVNHSTSGGCYSSYQTVRHEHRRASEPPSTAQAAPYRMPVAAPLIRFLPGPPSDSVPRFLSRRCDQTPGRS